MGNTVENSTSSEAFQDLWDAHQEVANLDKGEDIGDLLGGKVELNIDSGTFQNFCAIRLSHAFNEAGNPDVPKVPYIQNEVSSDAEKDWHIYRKGEMDTFMQENYGPPTISSNNPEDFYGHDGLISFQVDSWNDATGHVDLLHGDACGTKCYFEESSNIQMWVFDKPIPVNYVESDHLNYGDAIDVPTSAFPSWERNSEVVIENGIPIYTMDADGHLSENPAGKAFAKNFESENVSMVPVYDQDNRLHSFFMSEDLESGEGFYIQPQDIPPHMASEIAPNLPPAGQPGELSSSPELPEPIEQEPPSLPVFNIQQQATQGMGAAVPATP